jgi:hypothetical protein
MEQSESPNLDSNERNLFDLYAPLEKIREMYRQEILRLIQQRKVEADRSLGDLWCRLDNMRLDETDNPNRNNQADNLYIPHQ